MRIDELSRPSTIHLAIAVVERAGYKRLGDGSFGAVFQKPGDPWVLKLFGAADEAYLAFVALARAHPSPNFPVFKGKPVKVTDDYYAIRMEKLERFNFGYEMVDAIKEYLDHPELVDTDRQMSYFREYVKHRPSLKDACDLIIKHLLPTYGNDISYRNLMQRGSDIVITDPVFSRVRGVFY